MLKIMYIASWRPVLLLLLATVATVAVTRAQQGADATPLFKPATNCQEYQLLANDTAVQLIRNKQDFLTYISRDSVLKKVIANYTLKKILQDLVFTENHTASFSFDVLKRIYPQSYKKYLQLLLYGFGWAGYDELPDRVKNRYCKKGVIQKKMNSICLHCF